MHYSPRTVFNAPTCTAVALGDNIVITSHGDIDGLDWALALAHYGISLDATEYDYDFAIVDGVHAISIRPI